MITIAGKNITLLKAFDAIESQTQLSITYSRTKIDVNRTLSVDFKKQKLSIVLDKLLAGTGFTYKIEKGYIVLVPVPVKQEQTEATSKKIQGVIVDTNGDPVIGASIQEKGVAGKGTVSDLDGKFNLSVASNAVLLISYIPPAPPPAASPRWTPPSRTAPGTPRQGCLQALARNKNPEPSRTPGREW